MDLKTNHVILLLAVIFLSSLSANSYAQDITFNISLGIAPAVSNVVAIPEEDSATIRWNTDRPADSQVEYGLDTTYGLFSSLDPSLKTSHIIAIAGLSSSTIYHFRIISADSSGFIQPSSNNVFATLGASQGFTFNLSLDAPVVSNIAVSLTENSATITWQTNKPADSQIEYGLDSNYGFFSNLDATPKTSHSITITGLLSSTAYHYRILSADASGFIQPSSDQFFTTLSGAPSGDTGDGGGRGSDFVSTTPIDTITLNFASLVPEISVRLPVPYDFAIKFLTLRSSIMLSDVKVTIKKIGSANVPPLPGVLYRYLRMDSTNTEDISYIETEFDVTRSWLAANRFSVDDVRFLLYDNGWRRMPTYYIGGNSIDYRFRAVPSGFGTFAIVGDREDFAEEPTQEPAPGKEDEGPLSPFISPTSKIPVNIQYFIISAVLFIVAILLYLHYHRHSKKADWELQWPASSEQ